MQSALHTGVVQARGGAGSAEHAAVSVREQQDGIAMQTPAALQGAARGPGQEYKPIGVAFGDADMHAPTHSIDLIDLQAQALAQAWPQTR